jgi:hypothetical protein
MRVITSSVEYAATFFAHSKCIFTEMTWLKLFENIRAMILTPNALVLLGNQDGSRALKTTRSTS